MRKALICACSDYLDAEFAPLKYPLNDAEAFRSLLLDPGFCAFDEVELLPNPTRAEAHEAVERLTDDSTADDFILFYFSGHGKLTKDRSVALIMSDTKQHRLFSTGLVDDHLRTMFNSSRARQRAIILDCCHSGAAGEEGFKGTSNAVEALAQQIKGTFLLTASTKVQAAKECGELKASVFTSCLIEGVRSGEAAEKESGRISLSRLGEYVCAQVPVINGGQQPRFWDFGGVGATLFANSPRRFDDAWTNAALASLKQMLARDEIDDQLFVEIQQSLRGKGAALSPERMRLIDDLVQGRSRPFAFLRAWQDWAPQPPPPPPSPSPPPPPPPEEDEAATPLDVDVQPPEDDGTAIQVAVDVQSLKRGRIVAWLSIGVSLPIMLLSTVPWTPNGAAVVVTPSILATVVLEIIALSMMAGYLRPGQLRWLVAFALLVTMFVSEAIIEIERNSTVALLVCAGTLIVTAIILFRLDSRHRQRSVPRAQ